MMTPGLLGIAGGDVHGAPLLDWTDAEVEAATFADVRLHRRFADLLRQSRPDVGMVGARPCRAWH